MDLGRRLLRKKGGAAALGSHRRRGGERAGRLASRSCGCVCVLPRYDHAVSRTKTVFSFHGARSLHEAAANTERGRCFAAFFWRCHWTDTQQGHLSLSPRLENGQHVNHGLKPHLCAMLYHGGQTVVAWGARAGSASANPAPLFLFLVLEALVDVVFLAEVETYVRQEAVQHNDIVSSIIIGSSARREAMSSSRNCSSSYARSLPRHTRRPPLHAAAAATSIAVAFLRSPYYFSPASSPASSCSQPPLSL